MCEIRPLFMQALSLERDVILLWVIKYGMNERAMRFAPNSITGKRLRQHGVSSRALEKTRVYAIPWTPVRGLTVPLPLIGAIILIGKKYLDQELDGELGDSAALAPLIHQYTHVHQRLEWGIYLYFWRHMWIRLFPRGVPIRHRQAEREAYMLAQKAQEFYSTAGEAQNEDAHSKLEVSV